MLKLGVYALVVRGIGDDLLMGRNVNDYIKLHGLEDLLQKFIADLDKWFAFVYEDKIPEFLLAMQEKLLLDFTRLEEEITQNIQGMRDMNGDEIMIQYMIITKVLENLREGIWQMFLQTEIGQMYKALYKRAIPKKTMTKLKKLNEEGSKEFSLLYNLVFIHHLAKIYTDKDMLELTETQIEKKIKKIFEKIK